MGKTQFAAFESVMAKSSLMGRVSCPLASRGVRGTPTGGLVTVALATDDSILMLDVVKMSIGNVSDPLTLSARRLLALIERLERIPT